MMPRRFSSSLGRLLAIAFVFTARAANAQATATAKFGVVQGFVYDSVHDAPLGDALVMIDGLVNAARSNREGRYRIDSVPVGSRRLIVSHPLLDTIGMVLTSPTFTVMPSVLAEVD